MNIGTIGLGYTAVPAVYVNVTTNGLPSTVRTLDSYLSLMLQDELSSGGVGYIYQNFNGAPAGAGQQWIRDQWRLTAQQYCQPYAGACVGVDPNALADYYSGLLLQTLAETPPPLPTLSGSILSNLFSVPQTGTTPTGTGINIQPNNPYTGASVSTTPTSTDSAISNGTTVNSPLTTTSMIGIAPATTDTSSNTGLLLAAAALAAVFLMGGGSK